MQNTDNCGRLDWSISRSNDIRGRSSAIALGRCNLWVVPENRMERSLQSVRHVWASHAPAMALLVSANLVAVRKHLCRSAPVGSTPIRRTPAYEADHKQRERRRSHWGPRPGIGELFWSWLHQSSCARRSPRSRQSSQVVQQGHWMKKSVSVFISGLPMISHSLIQE